VLVAWDERHAIRAVHEYGEAAEADRRRDSAGQRARSRKRRLSILLAPLAGHLPGRVQVRMEGDFGAPARAMTAASALPLLVLGVLGLFGWFQTVAGARSDLLPWLAEHPFLCAWLVAESAVRLGAAFLLAEPIGSVLGTIVWEAWRPARRLPAEHPAKRPRANPEQAARDRFHVVEPLAALLSPEEQEELERRFGFDPLLWGRRSVRWLMFVGGINAFLSYGHWLAGGAAFSDAMWFVAGIALVVEQVRRDRVIRSGRPAASVLAGFVRPLTKTLHEDDNM
jgi:hypothetical protein